MPDHNRPSARSRYWRLNLAIMSVLLVAWAALSLGGGILFADVLNNYDLPRTGLPLGFWMAQQGSIIGFVFIILIYCVVMNFVDRHFHPDSISQSES